MNLPASCSPKRYEAGRRCSDEPGFRCSVGGKDVAKAVEVQEFRPGHDR